MSAAPVRVIIDADEARARGWDWVLAEMERLREWAAHERNRLLGPDRGE